MKEHEDEIRAYLAERGWDKLRPGDIAKSISIEAAELLEIFQWTNQTLEEVKGDAEKVARVKSELADILIYAIEMSILLELDTSEVIRTKLEKVKDKYPAHFFKDRHASTDPGSEDVYLEIKRAHREKENGA
jgi:dCTP diphosphatase